MYESLSEIIANVISVMRYIFFSQKSNQGGGRVTEKVCVHFVIISLDSQWTEKIVVKSNYMVLPGVSEEIFIK